MSIERFPMFTTIFLSSDPLTKISDSSLLKTTKSLKKMIVTSCDLDYVGNLNVLANVELLWLSDNKLETIPDMLNGVPRLRGLSIDKNSRMSCDRRMCWRRLWDRVRTPISSSDVMCRQPDELVGYRLLMVNPMFMNCNAGKCYFPDRI